MKSLFTIFCFLLFSVFASGQCTTDVTATTWGLHPVPSVNLEGLAEVPDLPACIGESYSYTFTVVVPSSFALPTGGNLGVTQATVASVSGLPSGLSYGECDPSSCVIPGGASGCFNIIGTPDASNTPGQFEITITLAVEGTALGISQTINLDFPPDPTFNLFDFPLDPYAITLNAASSCTNSNNDLANEISAIDNNPNPFSETTQISIEALKSGDYDFSVYNLLGEKVASSTYEFQTGTNQIEFDGSNLANGIYVYTISNENGSISKKMMISQ